MSVASELVAQRSNDIVANTPAVYGIKSFSELEIEVFYGVVGVKAVLNVDYTVELDPPNFEQVTVTFTTSLIDKINALLAASAVERNTVVVRRNSEFLSNVTLGNVTNAATLLTALDAAVLRDQELREGLSRAITFDAGSVGGEEAIQIASVQADRLWLTASDGVSVIPGPNAADIANAQQNAAQAAQSATAAAQSAQEAAASAGGGVTPASLLRAQFEALEVDESVRSVRLAGITTYAQGAVTVRRVAVEPVHPGKIRSADRVLPDGTTNATNGGWWEFSDPVATPAQFGALGNGSADDGAALQDLFDYIAFRPRVVADLNGVWRTSVALTVTAQEGVKIIGGKIIATAAMASLLTISGQGATIKGILELQGTQNVTSVFSNRHATHGLTLDGGGNLTFDRLRVTGFKRFGLHAQTVNNNQIVGTVVDAQDCGAIDPTTLVDAAVQVGVTNRADNGIFGPNQQSTLTLTFTPASLEVGDIVEFGGEPLLVQTIDAALNQVGVYPIPPAGAVSGNMTLYHGGAVMFLGNDAGLAAIDKITCIRCGSALSNGALYGPTIQAIHQEAGGIGMQQGRLRTGSGRITTIGQFYVENCAFSLIHSGGIEASLFIGNVLEGFAFDECRRLNYITAAGASVDPRLIGVTIFQKGTLYTSNGIGNPAIDTGQSGNVAEVSNRPGKNRALLDRTSASWTIKWDADMFRVFGNNARSVEIDIVGNGANGQPTGNVVLTVDAADQAAGITINGGASITVNGNQTGAYKLLMVFDPGNDNWIARKFVSSAP